MGALFLGEEVMRYFNGYIKPIRSLHRRCGSRLWRLTSNGVKGQSTLEYVVLIICVALALAAMQVYARRAISGKLKERADRIADYSYEPGKVTADITTKLTKEVDTKVTVERQQIDGDEEDVTITEVRIGPDAENPGRSPEKTERWGEATVAEPGITLY